MTSHSDDGKRIALALATLEDVEAELRQAAGAGLDFPVNQFVAKALTALLLAQRQLQGELA